jgi:Ca2+-binding RTX toxin-like protein
LIKTVEKGALMTSSSTGFPYGFFLPSSGPLNLVYTVNGSDPPPPVFEVITSPGDTSYLLPAGYQGMALLPGGTGSQLDVMSGNIGVIDTGSSNTIVLGTENDTIGGARGDTITGGTGADFIDGTAGNQSITAGSAGNETIWGGKGDTISGGGGANVTIGGAQGDTVTGGTSVTFIDGSAGNQSITGGAGAETIWGGAADTISGGGGTDTIGGAKGDTITGGSGREFIDSSAGYQTITAGSGSDTVWGGPLDIVIGGSGQALIGLGTGPEEVGDNNISGGADTVVGFNQPAGDRIFFPNESFAAFHSMIAAASVANGNTTIAFADGATMTLAGITHIDTSFFAFATL